MFVPINIIPQNNPKKRIKNRAIAPTVDPYRRLIGAVVLRAVLDANKQDTSAISFLNSEDGAFLLQKMLGKI